LIYQDRTYFQFCKFLLMQRNYQKALSPGQTIATWMPTQHIAILLGATCCARLATLLRHAGCCWLKFKFGQIWANNTQHVATCCNMVAKRTQHVAPNNVAIYCVGMLRSFGRGFTLLIFTALQCFGFNTWAWKTRHSRVLLTVCNTRFDFEPTISFHFSSHPPFLSLFQALQHGQPQTSNLKSEEIKSNFFFILNGKYKSEDSWLLTAFGIAVIHFLVLICTIVIST